MIAAETVDLVLLETVANGVWLGLDQAEMVRQLATSGGRVQPSPRGQRQTSRLRTPRRLGGRGQHRHRPRPDRRGSPRPA